MNVGIERLLDEVEVHSPSTLFGGLPVPEVGEKTGEDVARPSTEVDREAQLRVPRSQLGRRAESDQRVETTRRGEGEQGRPGQRLHHVGVLRPELVERVARLEFAETDLSSPPDRQQATFR